MGGEAADLEKRLYDVALTGDVTAFQQLLQEDPNLLDRVSYVYCPNTITPLHIATQQGNLGIVEEVLKRNPQLAKLLDSQKWSPLHIAAAEGYEEIASMLLSAAPNMCRLRDCLGMNPIHVAAMNGHVEILRKLIEMEPFAAREMCWQRDYQGMNPIHVAVVKGHIEILKELVELDHSPAMEKVDGGQTVMHLCVKHRRYSELLFLVDKLGDLVDSNNDDGETILHLAAKYEQVQMIKFLVENTKIDKQSRDTRGRTAFVILQARPGYTDSSYLSMLSVKKESLLMEIRDFLDKMSEATMVVSVLIAAMAFQATVSPPGGVWQEDSSTHKAGEAVMASTHPTVYKRYLTTNTLAFVFSFGAIIQLLNRTSTKHPFFIYSVVNSVLLSMACVVVSYVDSITTITPNTVPSLVTSLRIFVIVVLSVYGFNALMVLVTDVQSIMFLQPINFMDLMGIERDQHAT